MHDRIVGARIKQVRLKLGLTQVQFARRLGVVSVSVARYEAGRVPRLDLLSKIAGLGEVTVAWLLHGSKIPAHKVTLGPPELNLTEPIQSLLSFLGRHGRLVAALPRRYQREYEKRVGELVNRLQR